MNKLTTCINCKKQLSEHVAYKCLFEATTFLPSASTYGVVTNPAYQRWYEKREKPRLYTTTSALFIEPDFFFSNTSAVSFEPPRYAIEWECSLCNGRNFEPVSDVLASAMRRKVVTCEHCRRQNSIL